MKPYQQRVVDEEQELADKCDKLELFLTTKGPYLSSIPIEERRRLDNQLVFMESYLTVLRERIAAFD